jgi:predicted DNA-binding protein
MRRIGVPVVIRITDDMLDVAKKLAVAKQKPLRTLLREIIEDVLKEAAK